MKIQSKVENGIVRMRPGGRMTLDQITELDHAVREHLEQGAKKFVLNLSDVTDISSSGVGRLYQLHNTLQTSGGQLCLADLSQVCEYVLDLARMTDVFAIFATEEAAVAELSH